MPLMVILCVLGSPALTPLSPLLICYSLDLLYITKCCKHFPSTPHLSILPDLKLCFIAGYISKLKRNVVGFYHDSRPPSRSNISRCLPCRACSSFGPPLSSSNWINVAAITIPLGDMTSQIPRSNLASLQVLSLNSSNGIVSMSFFFIGPSVSPFCSFCRFIFQFPVFYRIACVFPSTVKSPIAPTPGLQPSIVFFLGLSSPSFIVLFYSWVIFTLPL